jgi:hypothetical protein
MSSSKRSRKANRRGGEKCSLLTKSEETRLFVAVTFGLAPEPICEGDEKPMVNWAKRTRINSSFLGLVLKGLIVPMNMLHDGEIGFGVVDGELSRAEARAYRDNLTQLKAAWEWSPSRRPSFINGSNLHFILTQPEKVVLRLAVEAGQKISTGGGLTPDKMLNWAVQVRNNEILLLSVLVGDIFPVVIRQGSRPIFRSIKALPATLQQAYRTLLLQIPDKDA